MKIEIKKELIVEALSKVVKTASRKTDMPVLQGIYLEVTDKELLFVTTDTQETVGVKIPVNEDVAVDEPGKVVMQKTVFDLIKKVTTDTVVLSKVDNSLSLIAGKSSFEIPTFNADEYPKITEESSESFLEMTFEDFSKAIESSGYCAATEDNRPILKGLNWKVRKDGITLVTTNAHVLSRKVISSKSEQELEINPPAEALMRALRTFDKEDKVSISVVNSHIVIQSEKVFYKIRLLEGNYPDTDRLLVTNFKSIVKLKKADFLAALEQIRLISEDQKIAKFTIENKSVVLTGNSDSGAKGHVGIAIEELQGAEEGKFAFNIKYMINHIHHVDSSIIQLGLIDSMKPIGILGEEEDGEYKMLLPCRAS